METKTHWKKVFNKDYLGSQDLDQGKDLVATIDHVEVRAVKDSTGKDGNCNVAVFKEGIKPMILNVTNCKTVKKFAGSNYIEDWNNIQVIICIKEVKAFGEEVEALRIRERQPKIDKPKLTPEHPKWGAAVDYLKKDGSTMDKILNGWEVSQENQQLLQEAGL